MKKYFLILFLIIFSALSLAKTEEFSYSNLGKLPILFNGRIQPFDSVARYNLLIIREKTKFNRADEKISATQWLWEVFTHNKSEVNIDHKLTYKIFQFNKM